jgi:ABC-type Fe2+-enterobactin transport system substrate-binding protein
MASKKGFVDTWIEKFTSRKLLVWSTASALAAFGHLTSSDWVVISAIYIGGQSAVDIVERLKKVS